MSAIGLNVSRETQQRLELFVELLEKWNSKINLVSRNSLNEVWTRHVLDSVQVFQAADRHGRWVDMGSGGGLPGLIIAILSAELAPLNTVTMIESDIRKCSFLRTVLRETGITGHVVSRRIEGTPPQQADVLSARALTDLSRLLAFSDLHLKPDGVAIFSKGSSWRDEVAQAEEQWNFDWEAITSTTDPQAVILKIQGVVRV